MILPRVRIRYSLIFGASICIFFYSDLIRASLLNSHALLSPESTTVNITAETEPLTPKNILVSPVDNVVASDESSEEVSEEEEDEDEDDEEEEEDVIPSLSETAPVTPRPQPVLLETKTVYSTQNHAVDINGTMSTPNNSETTSLETFVIQTPLPVRQKDEPGMFPPEESSDALLEILQTAVRETYLAFKGNAAKKKREELQQLEDNLKGQMQNLDIDLNAKIMAIDANANARITTLTEQIVSQRKEDILTFSDNLNQIAKANQVHLETLHSETQHLKATVDGLNKGQAGLSAKVCIIYIF